MNSSNIAPEKKVNTLSASKVIENFYIEPTPRQIPRLSVEQLGNESEDEALAMSYVYNEEDELAELYELDGKL